MASGVIDPGTDAMGMVTSTSDAAVPTDLIPICAPPMIMKNFVHTTNYGLLSNVVSSSVAFSGGRPQFTIQTDAGTVIVPRSMKLVFEYTRTPLQHWAPSQGQGVTPGYKGDWDTEIMDVGGWLNLFSTINFQVNKINVQSVQAPYVPQFTSLISQVAPQNLKHDTRDLELNIRQDYGGQLGQQNSTKLSWGNPWEGSDWSNWFGNDPTTAETRLYKKVDVYQMLWPFAEQRKWLTSESTFDIIFVLANQGDPSIYVTLAKQDTAIKTLEGVNACPSMISQPYKYTVTNMWLEYNQLQVGQETVQGIMGLNRLRPLSIQYPWAQFTVDPTIQNYALTNATGNIGDGNGSWFFYQPRVLLRSNQIQPRFIIPKVFATCTWSAPVANTLQNGPWGLNTGFTWQRTVEVPSMIYIRQWFISGNQWGRDPWLDMIGTERLKEIAIWCQMMEKKWERSNQFGYATKTLNIDRAKGKYRGMTADPSRIATTDGPGMQNTHPAHRLWNLMTRGPLIETLSADCDLTTLAINRLDQIEVEYYLMPAAKQLTGLSAYYDGNTSSESAAANAYLAPFMFADQVAPQLQLNSANGAGTSVLDQYLSIPNSVSLSIYWSWIFPSELTFGESRATAFAELQQAMHSTSIVPGTNNH